MSGQRMAAIRGKWLRNAQRTIRWSRIFAYVAVAVSGFSSLANPPSSVRQAAAGLVVLYVWAGLMALSATICAVGAVFDRWIGEYIGLIPLALTAAVFAFSALTRGASGVAGGAFLVGFFWFVASRWQEVALFRQVASRQARVRGSEGAAGGVE